MSSPRRISAGIAIAALLVLLPSPVGALSPVGAAAAHAEETSDLPRWQWPLAGDRVVVESFRAPAHEYGPGHRGIDLGTAAGAPVVSPAVGTVAFRGTVADRPLLTIDHGGGLVTTFEPLRSTLDPGDVVAAAQEIGVVDLGGHAPPGALHLGVRLDGEYINPMLLFDDVPRAILLPCCAPL